MENFAVRLKQMREEAGFTQEQLAEMIGVTRQAVSRWERGHTEPDMDTLMALSQALHTDPTALAFGKRTEPYKRFQKKYLVRVIGAFSCMSVIFLIMTFLAPCIKNFVNTHYTGAFAYFLFFQLLLPTTGYFSLGFGLASFVALFYRLGLSPRWKTTVFVLGLIAIAPSLLVMADTVLEMWIPGYTAHITFTLFLRTIALPPVHTLLYAVLPTASGSALFLGFYKIK